MTLLLVGFLLAPVVCGQPNNIIASTDDDPVIMRRFETEHNRNRISFEVEYRNLRDKTIKAIQFGFLSFNPFNSLITLSYATQVEDLAPYKEDHDFNDVSFWLSHYRAENHYTGVLFVNQVRMADGTIWETDKSKVLDKIGKQLGIPALQLPSDTTESKTGKLDI